MLTTSVSLTPTALRHPFLQTDSNHISIHTNNTFHSEYEYSTCMLIEG